MPSCLRGLSAALLASLLVALPAHAELTADIQDDGINAPGEIGFELQVNTTPRGRRTPEYAGEAVPDRGWRVTPALSWGLASGWEASVALPLNRDADGRSDVAGVKLALKWLPLAPQEGGSGWFAGAEGEFARLKKRFADSRSGFELRLIGGWRDADWLFALNPILGWNLSDGMRSSDAEVSVGAKVTRTVAPDVAVGLEYYSDLGSTLRLRHTSNQAQALFAVVDAKLGGIDLNFGVGWGLNRAADDLTVKAIAGYAF